MSRRSKKRNRKKAPNNRKQSKTLSSRDQINSMIAQKKYSDAISLLKRLVEKEQKDDDKRTLFDCLTKIEQTTEVIVEIVGLLNSIKEKNAEDYSYLALGSEILGDNEKAIEHYESSLLLENNGRIHFKIAKLLNGDHGFHFITKNKEQITSRLKKAIESPYCPSEAFIAYSDTLWGSSDKDWDNVEKVLLSGLEKIPSSRSIILKLARLYNGRFKRPERALELVKILIDNEDDSRALWEARKATEQLEQYNESIKYLDRIPEEEIKFLNSSKIRGDLFYKDGDVEKALGEYLKCIGSDDIKIKVLGLFSRAYINLDKDDKNSLEDLCSALKICFEKDFFDLFDDLIRIDDEIEHYSIGEHAERVCQTFLDDKKLINRKKTPELYGQLNFLKFQMREGEKDAPGYLKVAFDYYPHPIISGELQYHLHDDNLSDTLKHNLAYERWKLSRTPKGEEYTYSSPYWNPQNDMPSEEEASKVNSLLYSLWNSKELTEQEARLIFLPLYKEIWSPILHKYKMYDEMQETVGEFIPLDPRNKSILWDSAYSAHETNKLKDAEVGYMILLTQDPENASAMHNLSLIVEKNGNFDEAQKLSQRAFEIRPESELISKRSRLLASKLEEKKEEERDRENFLKSAVNRWPRLDYYKRQLLSTLQVVDGFKSFSHLAELVGQDEKYIRGHWKTLVAQGMIIETEDNYEINKHIAPLLKMENSHSVVTKVFHSSNEFLHKPVFNSRQEYLIYNILVGLFPNHLVFPNMAPQAIFAYQRMKDVLPKDDFQYYLNSQVDFCIVSTANYLPIIALEADSPFHDDEKQKERDERKNRIFEIGGVPLIRLRAYGKPNELIVRDEIIKSIRSLGESLRKTHSGKRGLMDIFEEIDFESFGGKKTLPLTSQVPSRSSGPPQLDLSDTF